MRISPLLLAVLPNSIRTSDLFRVSCQPCLSGNWQVFTSASTFLTAPLRCVPGVVHLFSGARPATLLPILLAAIAAMVLGYHLKQAVVVSFRYKAISQGSRVFVLLCVDPVGSAMSCQKVKHDRDKQLTD